VIKSAVRFVRNLAKRSAKLEALEQCTSPPRHVLPVFIGPLPTFPKNFTEIRSDVFAQSCQQREKKQANGQRRLHLHILLGGGNNELVYRVGLDIV